METNKTYKEAKFIEVGEFIMLKDQPCLVLQTRHSKPGRHAMKALLVGRNIFTNRKFEDIIRFQYKVEIIYPQFSEPEVMDIDKDDMVSLVDQNFELKQKKIPNDDDLRDKILLKFKDSLQKEQKMYCKLVKVKGEQQIYAIRQ